MARIQRDAARARLAAIAIAAAAALWLLAPGAALSAEEAPDPWESPEAAPAEAPEDRVIGRVVGMRGTVYVETPGQPRRLLVENAPIYPGDRLVTAKGAQLGVLSGDHYTGLSENTTLTYSKVGNGAPLVDLERGDVRLVHTGDGEAAQIRTPGMQTASAGTDTKAFAVREKAWMVSLVCALEGQVEVSGSGQSLVVDEGGCAASKPAGLFLAGAVPAVGAAGPAAAASALGDGMPVAGPASARFAGPGVGAPAGYSTPAAQYAVTRGIATDMNSRNLLEPCNIGACAPLAAPLPPAPALQPTNGWVGGGIPAPPTP